MSTYFKVVVVVNDLVDVSLNFGARKRLVIREERQDEEEWRYELKDCRSFVSPLSSIFFCQSQKPNMSCSSLLTLLLTYRNFEVFPQQEFALWGPRFEPIIIFLVRHFFFFVSCCFVSHEKAVSPSTCVVQQGQLPCPLPRLNLRAVVLLRFSLSLCFPKPQLHFKECAPCLFQSLWRGVWLVVL